MQAPAQHDALLEEDLVRALQELVEIVEIICAPQIPPPPWDAKKT